MPPSVKLSGLALEILEDSGKAIKEILPTERLLDEVRRIGVVPNSVRPSALENTPWLNFGDVNAIEPASPTKIPHQEYLGSVTRYSSEKTKTLIENPQGLSDSGSYDKFRSELKYTRFLDSSGQSQLSDNMREQYPTALFSRGTNLGGDNTRYATAVKFDRPIELNIIPSDEAGAAVRLKNSIMDGFRLSGNSSELPLRFTHVAMLEDGSVEFHNAKGGLIRSPGLVSARNLREGLNPERIHSVKLDYEGQLAWFNVKQEPGEAPLDQRYAIGRGTMGVFQSPIK